MLPVPGLHKGCPPEDEDASGKNPASLSGCSDKDGWYQAGKHVLVAEQRVAMPLARLS